MEEQNLETIMCTDDVLSMLDKILEKEDAVFWDAFWKDKDREVPFLTHLPDENLKKYIDNGMITKGKAMDIGCGNGRNSRFLKTHDFDVEAIDYSAESIKIAKDATDISTTIDYVNASFFDIKRNHASYDFIYDSGCLHHIKPHRRSQYLKKICNLLKPGSYFGLVCFNPNGAAAIGDHEIYDNKSMSGGLGYTEEKLKKILVPFFEIIEFKEMALGVEGESFGLPSLWTVLLKKADHH